MKYNERPWSKTEMYCEQSTGIKASDPILNLDKSENTMGSVPHISVDASTDMFCTYINPGSSSSSNG